MPQTLGEAYLKLRVQRDAMESDLAAVRGRYLGVFANMGSAGASLMAGAFRTGLAGIGLAAGVVGVGAGFALKLAAEAQEAGSLFREVFGGQVEQAGGALDAFASVAGRSKTELRAAAGSLGALIGPMGLTEQATADMSVGLAKLGTDLSSFFNTTESEALTALKAGLVGESEPLRKFGVQLSAARVEAEIFAKGMATTKDEITAGMKAQAAYSLIMQDTAKAQGDAERTSGSFSNQMRALKGQLTDTAVAVGTALIPAATEFVGLLKDIVGFDKTDMLSWVGKVGQWLKDAIAGLRVFSSNWAGTWALCKTVIQAELVTIGDFFNALWQSAKAGLGAFVDYMRASFMEMRNLLSAIGSYTSTFFETGSHEKSKDAFIKTLANQKDQKIPSIGGAMKGAWQIAINSPEQKALRESIKAQLEKLKGDRGKQLEREAERGGRPAGDGKKSDSLAKLEAERGKGKEKEKPIPGRPLGISGLAEMANKIQSSIKTPDQKNNQRAADAAQQAADCLKDIRQNGVRIKSDGRPPSPAVFGE